MSRENPATTHDNAGIAAWNVKLRAEIGSYEDCATFLDEGSTVSVYARELAAHMTVTRELDAGYCAVVLYDTEIIRYYPDGTFSVSNGGWNTPTTKYRLDAVLPSGWIAYHRGKKLGVWKPGVEGQDQWPVDHDVRLTP